MEEMQFFSADQLQRLRVEHGVAAAAEPELRTVTARNMKEGLWYTMLRAE